MKVMSRILRPRADVRYVASFRSAFGLEYNVIVIIKGISCSCMLWNEIELLSCRSADHISN